MRKLISMVMVLCMLMSIAAFAEQSLVLQDELPPVVVTAANAMGEIIAARVCDKDGNTIAEVKDDGTLILTDVHQREEAANEIVVVRLCDAYDGVMSDVHHSDVECLLHEHDVKVDINDVLASIDKEITAYDLVMYEMYDVMTSDEIAALLVDGNYLEVTFELVETEPLPLITMFSPDGLNWKVIPTYPAGANRFTVRLTELGTMALLSDGRETMGIGKEYQRVEIEVPGTEGGEYVEIPNFTPSVSGKPAPEMGVFPGEDGENYVGYIRNNNSDEEVAIPDKNYIVVTPVSERDYIFDIQTHEHLEWGYSNILNVENVGELVAEHKDETVTCDAHESVAVLIDEVLAQKGLDLTCEQLVIKDLFEITAYGEYLEYMYDEDHYLEFTFDANLDPNKALVVIHSADSEHWHVHTIEEENMNADGTVTLKMYDLGAVAFLVEKEVKVNEETAVQSPV